VAVAEAYSLLIRDTVARLRRLLLGAAPRRYGSLVDADLAVVYLATASRAMSEWLRWESRCKDRLGYEEAYCRRVEREVSSGDEGLGVVSYFNTELKKIIVRIVRDFSPGIGVPPWVVYYSLFRLRDPVTLHLAKLGPEEQLVRAPLYAGLVRLLDAVAAGLEEHYREKRSEIAATTGAYIYWELVRPVSVFADAFEEVVSVEPPSAATSLREEARSTGIVTGLRAMLEKVHEHYLRALARTRGGGERDGAP
jgi:hypothetical protein